MIICIIVFKFFFLVFCFFGFGAQSGFLFLVKSTSLTILVVFVGVLFSLGSKRVIDRVFKIDAELNKRFPGLLERSSLYRPIIRKIVDGILSVVAVAALAASPTSGHNNPQTASARHIRDTIPASGRFTLITTCNL